VAVNYQNKIKKNVENCKNKKKKKKKRTKFVKYAQKSFDCGWFLKFSIFSFLGKILTCICFYLKTKILPLNFSHRFLVKIYKLSMIVNFL